MYGQEMQPGTLRQKKARSLVLLAQNMARRSLSAGWYGIGTISQPGFAGMLQGTNVGVPSCELVFGRRARSAVLSDYDGPRC